MKAGHASLSARSINSLLLMLLSCSSGSPVPSPCSGGADLTADDWVEAVVGASGESPRQHHPRYWLVSLRARTRREEGNSAIAQGSTTSSTGSTYSRPAPRSQRAASAPPSRPRTAAAHDDVPSHLPLSPQLSLASSHPLPARAARERPQRLPPAILTPPPKLASHRPRYVLPCPSDIDTHHPTENTATSPASSTRTRTLSAKTTSPAQDRETPPRHPAHISLPLPPPPPSPLPPPPVLRPSLLPPPLVPARPPRRSFPLPRLSLPPPP